MIPIRLIDLQKYNSLDHLAIDYANEVSQKLSENALVYLTLYRHTLIPKGKSAPNSLVKIHGKTLKSIILTFATSKNRSKYKKASYSGNSEKTAVINQLEVPFTRKLEKKFIELTEFLSGQTIINGHDIKSLLTMKGIDLENESMHLNTYFSQLLSNKRCKKIILSLLSYANYVGGADAPTQLIFNNLKLNACPYCNRNYISYVLHQNEKVIGPTLDHFLPKSQHPFVQLSFFNLIPSCYVCNSNLKGQKPVNHTDYINPYLEGFVDAIEFKSSLLQSHNIYGASFTILNNVDPGFVARIKKNEELFQLNNIYTYAHGYDLQHLMNKCRKLQGTYGKTVGAILGKYGSVKEYYEYHLLNTYTEDDFGLKPLSKLTKDIAKGYFPYII